MCDVRFSNHQIVTFLTLEANTRGIGDDLSSAHSDSKQVFAWMIFFACRVCRELHVGEQGVLAAVGRVVTERLQGHEAGAFTRQHLSNLMWAYATLDKQPGSPMLDIVAKVCCAKLCPDGEMQVRLWLQTSFWQNQLAGATYEPQAITSGFLNVKRANHMLVWCMGRHW